MKPLFLIIFLVVALAGAGGGYYHFIYEKDKAVDNVNGVEQTHKTAKKKKHKKKSKYYEMSPLFLPMLDANGVRQIVSMSITLMVPNDKAMEIVKYMEPRLKDAYIQNLYGIFNRKVAESGIIPIETLKDKLNSVSKEILGEEIVEEVLLQVLIQRRI